MRATIGSRVPSIATGARQEPPSRIERGRMAATSRSGSDTSRTSPESDRTSTTTRSRSPFREGRARVTVPRSMVKPPPFRNGAGRTGTCRASMDNERRAVVCW